MEEIRVNKKGLAFSVLVAIIVAIAGVSLLLLTVTGVLPDVSRQAYCRAYTGVVSILPSPEEGEPRIPSYCLFEAETESEKVSTTDSTIAARKLAASSIACWEKVKRFGIDRNYTCFELSFENGIPEVYEKNVTEIMEEEGGCRYLENSKYVDKNGNLKDSEKCGSRNRIKWNVEGNVLKKQTLILIEYKQTKNERFIEVSA